MGMPVVAAVSKTQVGQALSAAWHICAAEYISCFSSPAYGRPLRRRLPRSAAAALRHSGPATPTPLLPAMLTLRGRSRCLMSSLSPRRRTMAACTTTSSNLTAATLRTRLHMVRHGDAAATESHADTSPSNCS